MSLLVRVHQLGRGWWECPDREDGVIRTDADGDGPGTARMVRYRVCREAAGGGGPSPGRPKTSALRRGIDSRESEPFPMFPVGKCCGMTSCYAGSSRIVYRTRIRSAQAVFMHRVSVTSFFHGRDDYEPPRILGEPSSYIYTKLYNNWLLLIHTPIKICKERKRNEKLQPPSTCRMQSHASTGLPPTPSMPKRTNAVANANNRIHFYPLTPWRAGQIAPFSSSTSLPPPSHQPALLAE